KASGGRCRFACRRVKNLAQVPAANRPKQVTALVNGVTEDGLPFVQPGPHAGVLVTESGEHEDHATVDPCVLALPDPAARRTDQQLGRFLPILGYERPAV